MSHLNMGQTAAFLPLETWLFLDNNQYGRLFAADGDKKDNDHVVETTAKPDTSDKYQWMIYQRNGVFYLRNKKYGFMFAADRDKYGDDHVVECAPDKTLLAQVPEAKKWQWKIGSLEGGLGWLISNLAYGQMFAADGDKIDDDHVVEASPSEEAMKQTGFKWIWQPVPVNASLPSVTEVFIDNVSYGYLFAAAGDKKDNDHLVETRPGDDLERYSPKFKWRLHEVDGQLYIQNLAYGFLFAADSDKDGEDFLLECDPDVTTLQQAIGKGAGNGKWRWFRFNDALINMKHGQVFATEKAVYDDDHGVRAAPGRYIDRSVTVAFQWRIVPIVPDQVRETGWLRLRNIARKGDMFAADSDKKGEDHVVEVELDTSGSTDKSYWKLYRFQDNYYLRNKNYGFLFAASNDKYGDDHVAECDPDVTELRQVLKLAASDKKWQWNVTRQDNAYQIRNARYGTLFVADGDKLGGDHVVEVDPGNNVKDADKARWRLFRVQRDAALDNLDAILRPASNCEWMSALPDEYYLTDIALPGTHDTAAIATWYRSPYAAQDMSIREQLDRGIRLLDIRIQIRPNGQPNGYDFYTCHGDIGSFVNLNVYQSLKSALDECVQFLNEYGKEVLVISLKVDNYKVPDQDKLKARQALKTFLAGYPQLWSTPKRPTLGEARGKVLLLNRITEDSLTFGAPVAWSDKTSGQDILPLPTPALRDYPGYVQDKYKNTDEVDKWSWFLRAIAYKPDNGLLLNFASAVTAEVLGVYIHSNFLSYFGRTGNRCSGARLGWSLWDYPNWKYSIAGAGLPEYVSVIDLIIDTNFEYSRYGNAYVLMDKVGN